VRGTIAVEHHRRDDRTLRSVDDRLDEAEMIRLAREDRDKCNDHFGNPDSSYNSSKSMGRPAMTTALRLVISINRAIRSCRECSRSRSRRSRSAWMTVSVMLSPVAAESSRARSSASWFVIYIGTSRAYMG
jgi:hypothetical protein